MKRGLAKNMKIGLVLSQPFAHSVGTDVRIRGLLEGLSKLGVEVHIITPFMDNISISQRRVFIHRLPLLSTRLGISNLIHELSRRFLNNPLLFKNIIRRKSLLSKNASSLGRNVYKISRKLDLDIVQAEQQIASLACIEIREKLDLPVVADFHGIWAEEMVASGVIEQRSDGYKVLLSIEKEIARGADAVTVVSEEMKTYIENSFGVPETRVVLIPNASFPRVEKAKIVKHPSKVVHAGTLHPWENVELFVYSIPFVLKRRPSAKFFLSRKGVKLKRIMRLASELGISPEFTWFPNSRDFFYFLESCDVGVISSTAHVARKMAYPAKLYDYLSVGLPVVANDVGAWTKIIKENRVGVVTDNDPEAFAEGILELLENPELIHECGERGIELVRQEFNYYRSAERLVSLYKRLV